MIDETEICSRVDWAAALLDTKHTEDVIITVSREKIAKEILRLRAENQRLREGQARGL